MVLEVSNSAGMSFGGATIVVTGEPAPAPGQGKDTPYITAGRVPGSSTISVNGSKFGKSVAVTINITKDDGKTSLASVIVFTDMNGVFEKQPVNVSSCGGSGESGSFEIAVQAKTSDQPPSNTVNIRCYT
jgi:hypothetical protein